MLGSPRALSRCTHETRPEVVATSDQTAETVACLLVEYVIARHGAPELLLSDRVLSALVQEVCKLVGTTKLNTSLQDIIHSVMAEWRSLMVHYCPSVLVSMVVIGTIFVVCVSGSCARIYPSFSLLYSREPRTPTKSALDQPRQVNFPDYCTEQVANLSDAWSLAHQNIERAQGKQKAQYDKRARESNLKVGDRTDGALS